MDQQRQSEQQQRLALDASHAEGATMTANAAAAERDRAIAGFFTQLAELAKVGAEALRDLLAQEQAERAARAAREPTPRRY